MFVIWIGTSKYIDDNIDGMEEYTMTLSKDISPGGDSSQNTHYAGPDHTVPTSINRLPALDCAVTKNPFSLSSMPTENYLKSKTTPVHILLH